MKGDAEHEGLVKCMELGGFGVGIRVFLNWVRGDEEEDEDEGSLFTRAIGV